MTNEKIMIVNPTSGAATKITTIDSTKRNQIKEYTVDNYSSVELADKIYNRIKDDDFTKLYIDANGVGTGLVDWVLSKLEKTDYEYNPKTGDVKKKSKGIYFSNGMITSDGGISFKNITADKLVFNKEEF